MRITLYSKVEFLRPVEISILAARLGARHLANSLVHPLPGLP